MSELLSSTTLKNDTRFDDLCKEVKKLAETEGNAGTSLIKTALLVVRDSASGAIEHEQVKTLYLLYQQTVDKRIKANKHIKPRKPMGKRVLATQVAKMAAFFHAGQIKSVIVESVKDDKLTEHDYSGEAAMDHVVRLYETMGSEAVAAYTAYGAAAVMLKKSAEANEHVTDAELIGAMSKSDKAKKATTSKDVLKKACDMIEKIMNGTMKGVEQDNAKEICDAHAILSGYLARLTLKEEHDAFMVRAAKVGYHVAKLESNPRPLAGRKRSQKRG